MFAPMPKAEFDWHFNTFKARISVLWDKKRIGEECRKFLLEEMGYSKAQLVRWDDDYIYNRLKKEGFFDE